jgi:hypothetical protein
MFVVFDVTADGQTADVSEMSFTLVSAFLNDKDLQRGFRFTSSFR